MRVSVPDLVALATGLLESAGVPAEDARVTADRLVEARTNAAAPDTA